ncbi:MAG TPA: Hsp20/alpha crystallin family protein [Woeseiaceae bacterium]|nr:Hsp20/alpha crystallin family protein [Woeseiaceae bacterium]
MNVTRFEPWRLFDVLHRDLDEIAGRRFSAAIGADGDLVADWVPAVDVIEEKDRFVLRADVPGVDPDAIDVSMEQGILTLAGARQEASPEPFEGLKRIERASGRFRRRFTLPEAADAEHITARTSNGILEVTIPKQPEVQPRRITVQAA